MLTLATMTDRDGTGSLDLEIQNVNPEQKNGRFHVDSTLVATPTHPLPVAAFVEVGCGCLCGDMCDGDRKRDVGGEGGREGERARARERERESETSRGVMICFAVPTKATRSTSSTLQLYSTCKCN